MRMYLSVLVATIAFRVALDYTAFWPRTLGIAFALIGTAEYTRAWIARDGY